MDVWLEYLRVREIKVDNEILVMRLTLRLELIAVRSCVELRSTMGGRLPFPGTRIHNWDDDTR